MISAGEGLRMMQGGVDRTGLASLADAIGTPGKDLLEKRRQEEALAAAIAAAAASGDISDPTSTEESVEDGTTKLSFSDVALGLLDPVGLGIDLIKGASERMTPSEISDFYQGDPMDQLYSGYGFDKSREMFDLQKGDTNIFGNEVLMDSPMLVDPEVRALYESALGMQDGGRVNLSQGGQGQTQRGGLRGGRRGFGRRQEDRGGNKNIQKEVDIDQLKKAEEPITTVPAYTGIASLPQSSFIQDKFMMEPVQSLEEENMIDTLSKYNPLSQTFDLAPGLSFDYDINPNLKDLSDLNATAGLKFSFDQGGPVYESLEDHIADQRAEELERKAKEFSLRMDEPSDKPSLEQYIEDVTREMPEEEFLDPPVGIDGNMIQMDPPIGIGGTITDDAFTAGYGMPIGTGGMSGQLTVPFESDPMLQLMLQQQLADDLFLDADVSLMEDEDPLFNLMLKKTF